MRQFELFNIELDIPNYITSLLSQCMPTSTFDDFFFSIDVSSRFFFKSGLYYPLGINVDEANYTKQYSKNHFRTSMSVKPYTHLSESLDDKTPITHLSLDSLQKIMTIRGINKNYPYKTSFIPVGVEREEVRELNHNSNSPDLLIHDPSLPLLIDQWHQTLLFSPLRNLSARVDGCQECALSSDDISTNKCDFCIQCILFRLTAQLRAVFACFCLPPGLPHSTYISVDLFELRLKKKSPSFNPITCRLPTPITFHVDISPNGLTSSLDRVSVSEDELDMFPDYPIINCIVERNAWGYVLVTWECEEEGEYTTGTSQTHATLSLESKFSHLTITIPLKHSSTFSSQNVNTSTISNPSTISNIEICKNSFSSSICFLCIHPGSCIPRHYHKIMNEVESTLDSCIAVSGYSFRKTNDSDSLNHDILQDYSENQSHILHPPLLLNCYHSRNHVCQYCCWGSHSHAHYNTSFDVLSTSPSDNPNVIMPANGGYGVVFCICRPRFTPSDEYFEFFESNLASKSSSNELKSLDLSIYVPDLPLKTNLPYNSDKSGFDNASSTSSFPNADHLHLVDYSVAASGLGSQKITVSSSISEDIEPIRSVLCAILVTDNVHVQERLLSGLRGETLSEPCYGLEKDIDNLRLVFVEHKTRGWELCGGKVDDGEGVFDTIVREVSEECGGVIDILGCKDDLKNKANWVHYLDLFIDDDNGDSEVNKLLNMSTGKGKYRKSIFVGVLVTNEECKNDDSVGFLYRETRRVGTAPLMLLPPHTPARYCCDTHYNNVSVMELEERNINLFVESVLCVGGKVSPLLTDQLWCVLIRKLQSVTSLSLVPVLPEE